MDDWQDRHSLDELRLGSAFSFSETIGRQNPDAKINSLR